MKMNNLNILKMKKSQAWSTDLVAGFLIFLIGILLFFIYTINYTFEAKENFELMLYEGELIAENILSEGSPVDWNEGDVAKIGILDSSRINETKLSRFYNFVQTDYVRTKAIFNTNYDYYFFLDDPLTIDLTERDGIGKPGTDRDNINPTNLIKITKITIYEDKPVTAYLYIWD